MYAALLGLVAEGSGKVTFKDVNLKEFKEFMPSIGIAVQYDHPEYFWFTGGYTYSYKKGSEVCDITVEPIFYDYVTPFFNREEKLSELNKRVKQVALLAKEHSADDYERIIFVHDYLIKNAVYDTDSLDEYYKTTHSPSCEYIFTAYGCLVNGKTVCSGYAKAFQLIMYELGYDCSYVVGSAGESHGWNCVYFDGDGYFIDVTWDDADYEREVPLYNYAFINEETLTKTHTIEMPFKTPVCDEDEHNFYIKKGYYLEKYSYSAAAKILSKQSKNESAYIKFGSAEALDMAINDFSKAGGITNIPGLENAVSYSYNKTHNSVVVFLE